MARILIIDSDQSFINILQKQLNSRKHQLVDVSTENRAIELLSDGLNVDLIVYGCNSHKMLYGLLNTLRSSYPYIPVIVLSNNDDVHMVVEIMQKGVKDFILKDEVDDTIDETIELILEQQRKMLRTLFQFEHLIANLIDHLAIDYTSPVTNEDYLVLDVGNHRAYFGDQHIDLTQTEFDILYCLWRAKGMVCQYKEIILFIHNEIVSTDEARSALAAHMSNLRHKLADVGCDDAVLTQRTRGYYLNSKYI